jgi:molybdopterin converting factor small subunit
MAKIIIPTPLRKFTNGQTQFDIQGTTVNELVNNLASEFPLLSPHLLDEKGGLRSYINLFVDDDDFRDLNELATEVTDKTTLSIVPAIAGGIR